MADLARIEERIDRVAVSALEVSDALGGIRFQNMVEVMEFAKCMAISETAVPKHLRGNPGMCLAICIQALEWRFSPFAVANKSYVVNDRIAYESQLVHAVIEQRAPITGRLKHRFEGEDEERRCIVTATLRETGETLEYISPPISKITPKNSPLWKTKPDLQLYYNTSRDFCRAYFPDVLLGVYGQDELRDQGPDNARDVTDKPTVATRLRGGKGRGFSAQHVERETAPRGVIDESATAQAEAAPATEEKPATEPEAQPTTEAPQEKQEAAPELNLESSAQVAPGADGEQQAGQTPAQPGLLPLHWEKDYALALGRALKPESLPKYAKQFWDQHQGWEKHKNGPDAHTAIAIYDAFKDHFHNKEAREAILNEIGAA